MDEIKTGALSALFQAHGKDWIPALGGAAAIEHQFSQIQESFRREGIFDWGQIAPAKENIFKAFSVLPFNAVKVVIVGQDPYPQVGANGQQKATGLAFEIGEAFKERRGNDSLKQILKEAKHLAWKDEKKLGGWTNQGVLLLNRILTVQRTGRPESHKNFGWERFTDTVFGALYHRAQSPIFLLWGGKAQAIAAGFENRKHILIASHPASRQANTFRGCGHFSRCNKILAERGETEILWANNGDGER